jgi:hypothetical protein
MIRPVGRHLSQSRSQHRSCTAMSKASCPHHQVPTAHAVKILPELDTSAQQNSQAKELLFFHLLGVATDIVGFNSQGDLELSFTGRA